MKSDSKVMADHILGHPRTVCVIDLTERMSIDITPQQRIDDMIQVAHMCIELFTETEEYYGEVRFRRTCLPAIGIEYPCPPSLHALSSVCLRPQPTFCACFQEFGTVSVQELNTVTVETHNLHSTVCLHGCLVSKVARFSARRIVAERVSVTSSSDFRV